MIQKAIYLLFFVCSFALATKYKCPDFVHPPSFQAWIAQLQGHGVVQLTPTSFRKEVLVVGAGGAAGLSMVSKLEKAGIAYDAMEMHTGVGGLWDSNNPVSPAYDGLITNSSRATTYLVNPMPKGTPAYLPKDFVLDYFQQFAFQQNLQRRIKFRHRVDSAEQTRDGTWKVVATNLETGSTIVKEYRAIIAASGTHNRNYKVLPPFAKEMANQGIQTMHSADYRNANDLGGKNVLVVGFGNSGSEIATEVSKVAKNTYLSIRTPSWVVPLYALGKPADELAATGPKLPHKLEMFFFHVLQRIYTGHPKKLGLPAPPHGILDRLPISDRGIAEALRKIQVRSTVDSIQGNQVIFASGETDAIDVAIFATGYQRQYPYLPDSYTDFLRSNSPLPSLMVFHPTQRGLFFLTEVSVPQGVWPIFGVQADAVIATLEAERDMTNNFIAFDRLRGLLPPDYKGKLFRAADLYHVDPKLYVALLKQYIQWIGE